MSDRRLRQAERDLALGKIDQEGYDQLVARNHQVCGDDFGQRRCVLAPGHEGDHRCGAMEWREAGFTLADLMDHRGEWVFESTEQGESYFHELFRHAVSEATMDRMRLFMPKGRQLGMTTFGTSLFEEAVKQPKHFVRLVDTP